MAFRLSFDQWKNKIEWIERRDEAILARPRPLPRRCSCTSPMLFVEYVGEGFDSGTPTFQLCKLENNPVFALSNRNQGFKGLIPSRSFCHYSPINIPIMNDIKAL